MLNTYCVSNPLLYGSLSERSGWIKLNLSRLESHKAHGSATHSSSFLNKQHHWTKDPWISNSCWDTSVNQYLTSDGRALSWLCDKALHFFESSFWESWDGLQYGSLCYNYSTCSSLFIVNASVLSNKVSGLRLISELWTVWTWLAKVKNRPPVTN